MSCMSTSATHSLPNTLIPQVPSPAHRVPDHPLWPFIYPFNKVLLHIHTDITLTLPDPFVCLPCAWTRQPFTVTLFTINSTLELRFNLIPLLYKIRFFRRTRFRDPIPLCTTVKPWFLSTQSEFLSPVLLPTSFFVVYQCRTSGVIPQIY